MMKNISILVVVILGNIFFFNTIKAQAPSSHFTVIINQVRGTSCCDKGSLDFYKQQTETLSNLQLKGNFSFRYDALNEVSFVNVAKEHTQHEIGGLLEIIPQLANDAGVQYLGDDSNWHEADHVFLIGYNQEERQKLIDTYMEKFKTIFGEYPKFTNAWMIDAWSLEYLKNKYGVLAHEITREQYGTDSYTLYGGPVHYPYWPSTSWALMPDETNKDSMPLVMRQTITDPVYVYGDNSDSYTSQPNDYFIRNDTTEYFKYTFSQAHTQPNNPFTFALVGLENSMPENVQTEYIKQLEFIDQWQNDSNKVLTVSEFESAYSSIYSSYQVYEGIAQKDIAEQAWWVNTPTYRARIRQSDNQLFISDLRIYNPQVKDPYFEKKSTSFGWWVTPFVLDGSRFFYNDTQNLSTTIRNDYLIDRKTQYLTPTRINLNVPSNVFTVSMENNELQFKNDQTIVASFNKNNFYINSESEFNLTSEILKPLKNTLVWKDKNGDEVWGFKEKNSIYTPFINANAVNAEREQHPQLLFPELKTSAIDPNTTSLFVNNAYAIAGRNPVRLVLFPKDSQNNPVILYEQPKVETSNDVSAISLYQPHGSNGMIFIDINNDQPQANEVSITLQNFSSTTKVFLAPNCKQDVIYCLTHPRQTWWYVRSMIEDKQRSQKEKESKEEKFVDG